MILEGLVTTVNAEGEINLAPMGPVVDESMETLALRPYKTSQTYRNLRQQPQGVFHVTDDVLLLARAAIGQLESLPLMFPAKHVAGWVVSSACRWYEFEVLTLDDSAELTHIQAKVVYCGRLRDFFGFNRAKHAVVEAAILATRLHLLPAAEVHQEFERLKMPVSKTAGKSEMEAFDLLVDFVMRSTSSQPDS